MVNSKVLETKRGHVNRAVKVAIGAAVALTISIGSIISVGLKEAGSRPVERRLHLAIPGWPLDADHMRIALLSDIHFGNRAMGDERLNAIVEQVNAEHPDIVLLAGDFLTGHNTQDAAPRAAALVRPLSRLRAKYGTFAVLGNHDHWTAPIAVQKNLARAGVTVLTNSAVKRGQVVIVGIDDAFSGHDDVASALSAAKRLEGIPIVLTHTPDLVHKLPRSLPLVLAGHTHCGQVVIPGFGALFTRSPRENWRSLYDKRYRCGVIRDADHLIVVTAGLGSGSNPIRLGAPPDWWLLTLDAGSKNSSNEPIANQR